MRHPDILPPLVKRIGPAHGTSLDGGAEELLMHKVCRQGAQKRPLLGNMLLDEVMAPSLSSWQRNEFLGYLPNLVR